MGGKKGGKGGGKKKGGKSSSSSSSHAGKTGSCRHGGKADAGGMRWGGGWCEASGCGAEEELRVCLGCGGCWCRPHAKRHWAKQPSDAHSLFCLLPSLEVVCFSCSSSYPSPLSGPVALAVDALSALIHHSLDPSSAEEPVSGSSHQHQQQSPLVHLSSSKTPLGLSNLGNTCFFNSIIQNIAHLQPFLDGSFRPQGPVAAALESAVLKIWTSSGKSFNPSDLLKQVRSHCPQFRRGTQEDAHELFRGLMDVMDEEFKRTVKNATENSVRQLFFMETTSLVTCHTCQKTFMRQEETFDLSVEMAAPAVSSDGGKGKKRASDSLDGKGKRGKDVDENDDETLVDEKKENNEQEELFAPLMPVFLGKQFPKFSPGVYAGFVERPLFDNSALGALGGGKKVVVATPRLEPSGVFNAQPEGKVPVKFLQHFSAPEVLKGHNRYMCSNCKCMTIASKQLLLGPTLPQILVLHFKRFAFSGRDLVKIKAAVPALQGTLNLAAHCVDPNQPNTCYKLRGVVVHHGSSLRSGHYVCHVSSLSGRWRQISDTQVRPSSLEEALKSEVYLAFFERDNTA